jgi:amidohydrolase
VSIFGRGGFFKMIDFFTEANRQFDTMVHVRREMHKNPEIDRDLHLTAKLVCSLLEKNNITYKRYENNGIIAEIGVDKSRIIALRADMDALEINDLKDAPYSSQREGFMHACGHDAHTAIQLGAALILKSIERELKGTVRLIFQPAEETDGGAKDMIELGALEGVNAILGLHMDETLSTGVIGVKKGLVAAASNPFKIEVWGKGSHGAQPQDGIDTIYIAAKIIDNLQEIVSREIGAVDNAVITIGKINGGTTPNAVSSYVSMEGILRTVGKGLRAFGKERIKEIAETTATMYRGKASASFIESYPSYMNDDNLYKWFKDLLAQKYNEDIFDIPHPTMGVEDFAYYTEKVPGLYYRLGCRNEAKGIFHPAHGSYFDIDEESLKIGCAVQSMCAYHYLL